MSARRLLYAPASFYSPSVLCPRTPPLRSTSFRGRIFRWFFRSILRRFIWRQFLRSISVVFAPVLIFRRRRLQLPLGVFLFFERIFLRRIFLALVLEYPVKFRQLLQPFSFIHVVRPRVLQRAQ
jgi:hypothetical protein